MLLTWKLFTFYWKVLHHDRLAAAAPGARKRELSRCLFIPCDHTIICFQVQGPIPVLLYVLRRLPTLPAGHLSSAHAILFSLAPFHTCLPALNHSIHLPACALNHSIHLGVVLTVPWGTGHDNYVNGNQFVNSLVF